MGIALSATAAAQLSTTEPSFRSAADAGRAKLLPSHPEVGSVFGDAFQATRRPVSEIQIKSETQQATPAVPAASRRLTPVAPKAASTQNDSTAARVRISTTEVPAAQAPVAQAPVAQAPATQAPVAQAPVARSLFRVLRGEISADAASELPDQMQLNDIMLTNGTEDVSGQISIPSLQPVPDHAPSLSGGQPIQDMTGHVSVVTEGCCDSSRRPNRKMSKRGSRGKSRVSRIASRFVEFYDPACNCPDPDGYYMPVLLVAGEEPQDDLDEDMIEVNEGDRLLDRKLTDIRPTLDYAWGDKKVSELPTDFYKRIDHGQYVDTVAPRMVLQWAPSNLWYHPLYFEDPGLERYGHTRHKFVQPFVSSGRFLGQVVGLPYQMTLHPPHCPEYALGYYQPGECAPKLKYQIPWNEEAAAVQFLWIAGFVLLIP